MTHCLGALHFKPRFRRENLRILRRPVTNAGQNHRGKILRYVQDDAAGVIDPDKTTAG